MKMETNKNVTSLKLFLRYPPLIKIMLAENTLNRQVLAELSVLSILLY